MLDFVRHHPTTLIIPASDGSVAALLPRRSEFSAFGAALALSSTRAVGLTNDKARTLEATESLGIATPRTVRVSSTTNLSDLLGSLPLPFVLKPVTSWAVRSALRFGAVGVVDAGEARQVVGRFLDCGVEVLAQQWIPGRREALTLFIETGVVKAHFAHVEHRTTPVLGGASVVRESIPVPADIYLQSVQLVNALGLDGLCGVEFRRDRSGKPFLMEINARLAGSVGSAMSCGIDFPRMLWRSTMGMHIDPVHAYQVGKRMRWLRGDMRWLRDNQRQQGLPDSLPRGRAVLAFLAEFFRSSKLRRLRQAGLGPGLCRTSSHHEINPKQSRHPR